MRVAQVGLRGIPAEYSGVERAVEEIGSRLVGMGHEVVVYCMSNRYPKKRQNYRGIELNYIPSFPTKNLEMISYAIPSAIAAAFHGFDIVHFHALGPSTLSWIPRLLGKPTVVTVHGLDWQRAKWSAPARLYLRIGEITAVRCPAATIVVSKALKTYYKQNFRSDVTYIPNGVNLFSPTPFSTAGERFGIREREYLLYVGRLTREKNIHLLINAFKRVKTNMKLIIVGGSSHSIEYVRELEEISSSDSRIRLTGPIYDDALEELYSNAYLFVLPSEIEGLPIVLLEALAHGNAVLVSDISENLEVIGGEGRRFGFTFSLSDPGDLAAVLKNLVDDPSTVRDFRRLGRDLVARKYNWDHVAQETERVYLDLLEARPKQMS